MRKNNKKEDKKYLTLEDAIRKYLVEHWDLKMPFDSAVDRCFVRELKDSGYEIIGRSER